MKKKNESSLRAKKRALETDIAERKQRLARRAAKFRGDTEALQEMISNGQASRARQTS
jgi:hypothetical protein